MKLLVVDSTIRPLEESRTAQLLELFLDEYEINHPEYEIETVVLRDLHLQPLLAEDIIKRDEILKVQDWSHPMLALAKQFAEADKIVIAAPYWDLCFPSILKVYLEHIFVCGVTFAYEGPNAVGKCKADELFFLQSAGGFVGENDPGKCYIQGVCNMFGIANMTYFCAQGVDIQELDQKVLWENNCKLVAQMLKINPN